MTDILWYIGGVAFIALGIGISIGLHELGHLYPAKKFGVKVPHYAIGFGPTLFKFSRGETTYALKLIPLGGYITMLGMYPPEKAEAKPRTGFFGRMITSAREAHSEFETPADANRKFYQLPVLKRMVIMFGGPFMNLVLGTALLAIVFSGIGVNQPSTLVQQVSACVPATPTEVCNDASPASPALAAGIKAGDRILSINGSAANDLYAQIQALPANKSVAVVVQRAGATVTLNVVPTSALRQVIDESTGAIKVDANGEPVLEARTVFGIVFGNERVAQPIGTAFEQAGLNVSQVAVMLTTLPNQLADAASATFGGGERNPNGAISVVGIGQIAGTVAAADQVDLVDKLSTGLLILASLNFALFTFNMIPLLPLDGGHIAGGVYESIKRGIFRLRGKKDPGPADTALLTPATWLVFMVLLGMSALLILADLINPIAL